MSHSSIYERALTVILAALAVVVGWLFNLLVGSMSKVSEQAEENSQRLERIEADLNWIKENYEPFN